MAAFTLVQMHVIYDNVLHIIGAGANIAPLSRPVRVEKLAARPVDPLISMSAKEIALSL